MKLGEAYARLSSISDRVRELKGEVHLLPYDNVVQGVNELNLLLRERQLLENLVDDVEAVTFIEGRPLSEVLRLLTILKEKISFLREVSLKEGLTDEHKKELFQQLDTFRATKDTLDMSIARCAWSTDLVEDE